MESPRQISQNQQEVDQSRYFQQLKKNIKTKKPLEQASEVESIIQGELDHGNLEIKENPQRLSSLKKISQEIHRKSADFYKQLLKLNLKMRKKSYSVRGGSARSLASFRSNRKTQITQEQFREYRERQLNASRRLKSLKDKKEQTQRKKLESEKKNELARLKEQAKKLKIEEEKLKQKQRLKTENISKKIKQIQQRREERFERLKNSRIKSTPILPKYVALKKRFQTQQSEFNEIKALRYKNSVKQRMLDNNPIRVRQHAENYQERMKSRINSRSRIKTEAEGKHRQMENNFNLLGKNEEQLQKRTEKWKKMHEFQKNVARKIKLKTNIEKQVELQIAKDKMNNPQKYNFLGQKALNDYVIYKEFDEFGLNIDKKNLGDQYLKQIKDKVKNSRIKTNPVEVTEERKKYKNYLSDARKNIKPKKQQNQIEGILKKYNNKSEAIEALQERSQSHTTKAMEKIKKLKLISSYENSLKAEGEIDSQYISSIKARLACLEIS